MGNLLSFKRKSSNISRQELIEMGKTAREERDRLLNEYPDLREFQNRIDRCLDNAGSSENRMAVLGIMIEAKLKDLREELAHLSSLMQQFKITNLTYENHKSSEDSTLVLGDGSTELKWP